MSDDLKHSDPAGHLHFYIREYSELTHLSCGGYKRISHIHYTFRGQSEP